MNCSTEQRNHDLICKRRQILGPGYKLMYDHPVEFVRASGAHMFDKEGNAYLDCYNNVVSVGHCNARVVEAITEQVKLLNTHTRYLDEKIINYSENLLSTFEPELSRVMYACSASEAVDLALRVAKFNTGGTGMIISDFAYHGTTDRVAALSPQFGENVPIDSHARQVRAPDAYRYEDVEQLLADDVAEAIRDMNRHGIKFAGFIADIVFTADGMFPNPAGFLKKTVDVVHQHGGLFIADEVQSGFGRTGSHMWGYQRHGIVPDLVVMGKPMGNGMPISAMVSRSELVENYGKEVYYFNTFAGNPVCIAAAQAVLNEIQNGLLENCRKIGAYLLEGLQESYKKYPQVGDIRGVGLFLAVELVKDRKTKEPDTELAEKIVNDLKAKRVLINASGPHGNILKIRPLLCFNKSNANEFLEKYTEVLSSVCKGAVNADITDEFATTSLSKYYGLEASLSKLASERDQTFCATTNDRKRVLLKFIHPDENQQVANFQIEAVDWIGSKSDDSFIPRVLRSCQGKLSVPITIAGSVWTMWVSTFIEGIPQGLTSYSITQSFNIGQKAGELTKCLTDFVHPSQHRHISWDLQHASHLHNFIDLIGDLCKREKLIFCEENFKRHVQNSLLSLRKQVVHNDINCDNVFLYSKKQDAVAGIIDFGDIAYTAIANDVAIGAYYQYSLGGSSGALAFVKGYHSSFPLYTGELDIIFDLLLTRAFVNITQSARLSISTPENIDYVGRFTERDWKLLDELLAIGRHDGRLLFLSVNN